MSAIDLAVLGAAGAAALASWAAVGVGRARTLGRQRVRGAAARVALAEFADRALDLDSLGQVLGAAGDTARRVFACTAVVSFERSGEDAWEGFGPGGEVVVAPSAATRSTFGWFRFNPLIATAGELGQRRFGAMQGPLREVMAQAGVDLLIPLVDQSRVLAVLGLRLGRMPDETEGQLLKLFRLQITAACANVRLHRDAARVLTMAKELDLAGAVKLALSPDEPNGAFGPIEWAGHDETSGDVGSDFWAVYPLGATEVMVVIGDAVGRGLGGTMVSAVIKSCCDAVFDGGRQAVPPAELLSVLNAALYRPAGRPAHAACMALLFQIDQRRVTYASAGVPAPYRLRFEGDGVSLGVLAGAGPLLGDAADVRFQESRVELGSRELFLVHTDGLVKASGRGGVRFGDRRLQKALLAQQIATPAEVRDGLLTAVAAHRDGKPLSDDLAMVVVRVS